MVKLTTKFLFRKVSKKNQLQPRKKEETDLEYLKRITHLHLQGQFIDKIAPMPECHSVCVIYLQNNLLQTIENLESFPNLTHLHLQHNYLSKIENLEKLKSLRKLYLGYNEISVVENLEALENLTELHLERQHLPQGETLYFDPRTTSRLKNSLKVLNISSNNLTSIRCLSNLTFLTKLIVEDNQLNDINDVMKTISVMPMLETLSSEGNPVANDRKYLDAVIVASKSLKTLNGKNIDEQTRIFITNLEYNKECRRKLSEFSTRVFNSKEGFFNFQGDSFSFGQIPSKTSRMGSKLFPVLKNISEKNKKIFASESFKGSSPTFENSVKVSLLSGSASYYL